MGEQLWKNFLDSIISVIEVVCARPEMLSSYSDVIILHTLPLLANLLVSDKNSGSKLLYIKLINDLLEILIEKREHGILPFSWPCVNTLECITRFRLCTH